MFRWLFLAVLQVLPAQLIFETFTHLNLKVSHHLLLRLVSALANPDLPPANTWFMVEVKGSQPIPLCSHASVALDAQMYVFGGIGQGAQSWFRLAVFNIGKYCSVSSIMIITNIYDT